MSMAFDRKAHRLADIPLQDASLDIWDSKYRLKTKVGDPVDRDIDATYERVARALADVEPGDRREKWYQRFLWALRRGAIPAGRIISNAGAEAHKPATSTINCTVSGLIKDSMHDILEKVHEAGLTLKAGCVAPGTRVYTERGLVTADRAVAERHARILCYDREARRFEMRRILRHLTTRVPRAENIEIVSNGARLRTSVKHPVLVYRAGRLVYVRADEVRDCDALVHHRLEWTAAAERAAEARDAGARLAGGAEAWPAPPRVARRRWVDRVGWTVSAKAFGGRLRESLRAAERELLERSAALFQALGGARSDVVSGAAAAAIGTAPAAAPAAATPVAANDGRARGDAAAGFRGGRDWNDAAVGRPHRVVGGRGGEGVPEWIRTHPERHFLPFLAGLIEAGGAVARDGGGVTLALRSPAVAADLERLLRLFGVRAAVRIRSEHPAGLAEHAGAGGADAPASAKARGSAAARRCGGAPGAATLKISDSAFLAAVAVHMREGEKRERIRRRTGHSGPHDAYVLPAELEAALALKAETVGHKERQALGFYHGYHRRRTVSRIWLERWAARFPDLGGLVAFARTLRPVDAVRRGLDLPETFYDFHVEGHNNYVAGCDGLVVIHNCGIGYEFSTLRPRGAYVSGAGAYTSGPLSFMDIYDKMCFTVSSAGGRRGAQMGTFDVGHPDVLEFIRAKREDGRLRQFNLSLLVTDEFLQAVKADAPWQLAFPVTRREADEDGMDLADPERIVWRRWPPGGDYVLDAEGRAACRVYRTLPARRLWDMIMSSTYDFAEPGFVLIDRVNELNNNWWCENIRATNPCVTADTRLATQFGMVRIGDLYGSGVPLEVTVDLRALGERERGTAVRPAAPAFMTSASADVYRVVTKDGYEIKATEWHDFYTTRGKIKLEELEPGDELLIQSGKGQFGKEGSEQLGLLLGLLTGDGHFTNRGKGQQAAVVNLWGLDRAFADSIVEHINKLIAGVSDRPRDYRVSAVAIPDRNLVMIRSVLLARVLEHYGFCKATKLRVPEVVWRGTEECVKAYLRGLFQADGTVNISGKGFSCSVRLASSHPSLLKDVQMLLANLGIFCRVLERRKADSRLLPDGHGGVKRYRCQADYELIVDGESRNRFMSEIGFVLGYKNRRYWDWAEQHVLTATQSFTSKISKIEYVGRAAVYDTTQADRNSVIFNGLLTGQCGEQPLPEFGSCLLGSVNLTKFVVAPFTEQAYFDWDEFRDVVKVFTRMLDNVVEINGLPLPEQRREITTKRRHGMGFLGLGSAITLLGLRYGSPESVQFTEDVARELAIAGWETGLELGKEKGAAPILLEEFEVTEAMLRARPEMREDGWTVGDRIAGRILHSRYSRYMQRLAGVAPELVAEIERHGARFTHHSSIAPTGTISLSLANNASNGIEPSFAHHYFRNVIRTGRKSKERVPVFSFELLAYRQLVNPNALPGSTEPGERLPDCFVSSEEVSPSQHVDIQAAAQKWIDSSISKTANVPTEYPYEEFKDIYLYAHEQGLKGCTTFRFNPEAFQGVLVKEKDLKSTTYRFTLDDGTVVEVKGDEEIEYDGEVHTAANLFDALKEGYYGKF